MDGVQSTIEFLDKNNIKFNGVNRIESDFYKVEILERKNVKIGIFAHTFGLNAHSIPKDRPQIINKTNLNDSNIDFTQIKQQIAYCKTQNVDFVILHLHWGLEHEFYPTPEQIDNAHILAEMGVDAIFCHHPHVIQPFEVYQSQIDPSRFIPIFYSLGNLINSFKADFLCKSMIGNISIVKGEMIDGTVKTFLKQVNGVEVFQKLIKQIILFILTLYQNNQFIF
ncbi:MAG: CapA family protein [Bacteriovoracaceae bacterium]